MADRPIIFSASMVRALLDGRKTQTRRILQPQPYPLEGRPGFWNASGRIGGRICVSDRHLLELHHHAVGHRLWVREAHSLRVTPEAATDGIGRVWFRADPEWGDEVRWRSPIHMPRWASRLTLTVTDVRVQRLQEISEADSIAEGVRIMRDGSGVFAGREGPGRMVTPWPTAAEAYADIWTSLHGPNAWSANPWVVALTFTVEQANIDALREAA